MATVQGWRPALAVALAVVAAVSMLPNVPVASGSVPGVAAPHLPPPTGPVRTTVEVAPGFAPPPGTVDLGPLPPTTRIAIAIGLPSRDPAALAAWDAEASIPGSPAFHHPLSSSEAAARFGASPRAIDGLTNFLGTYGLRPAIDPDGLLAYVQGTSATLGSAFGTSFEEYRAPSGRLFYSHARPASLPTSFPWTGVLGLGNSTPLRPALDPSLRGPTPGPAAGCSTGGGIYPCAIEQAYNATPLLSAGTNGSGERIAVVDAYSGREPQPQLESDLAQFATDAGVAVGNVEYLYPVPASGSLNTTSTNPDWGLEEALDLEWARGIAPGATVEMTFSPNSGPGLYAAIDWLVAHKAADVISLSWGEPDVGVYNAYNAPCSSACNASSDGSYGILSPVLAFAAAEGISVFAASGDCGSADGTSGVATNYPASDPDVTGVGGTVLEVDSDGNYIAEAAWSGNASGALSPGCENQGGSGGGYSPFPRPPWQTGLPSGDTDRGVPDVALDAGSAVMVIRAGSNVAALGTSVATPIWAGIAAIADQSVGRSLGFLNPTLYAIAAGANYSHDFHDIVSGSNGYSAGPGWDPVTGWGTPMVMPLVIDLAHPPPVSSGHPAAFVYASPRFGQAPLSVAFRANVTGGSGTYPLEGVYFGNGNASFAPNGSTTYTFVRPGVYSVQAYVADSDANYSVSPPVAVVVGGGHGLSVNLTASTESPARGAAVGFTVNVSGGLGPYQYNFSFGDGAFLYGASAAATNHTYGAAGSFCAEVVVADSATPVDGGASARVAVGAGGAARPNCENDTVPLSISPNGTPAVMDAPADFPSLFTATGGSTGAGSLAPSLQYSSTDPYVSACECTIFRSPGSYEVTGYANDSESQQANATVGVTVAPPLVGTFTASPTFGPAPLTVDFSASATGGVDANSASTNWTFGDGRSAVGASVAETFSVPGFYLAVGHVADRGSGNASEAFLIDVELGAMVPESLPPPPYLVATVTPAVDVPTGAPVNFTARLLTASGADVPAVFWWHFGSDSVINGFGAYRSSFNWTANWVDTPGNGTLVAAVRATVIASGATVGAQLSLPSFDAVVHLTGGEEFHPQVDGLVFAPSLSNDTVLSHAPWIATVSVSGPGVVSTAWVLGDGTEAASLSVNHTFQDGLYSVVATASDTWGDSATADYPVESASLFELSATVSPTSGSPPLDVSFRADPSGGVGPPYRFNWTFEDLWASSAPNGTATYDSYGTYRVTLTVGDLGGFGGSMNWTVTVRSAPSGFPALILLGVGAVLGVATALAVSVVVRRSRPAPFTP